MCQCSKFLSMFKVLGNVQSSLGNVQSSFGNVEPAVSVLRVAFDTVLTLFMTQEVITDIYKPPLSQCLDVEREVRLRARLSHARAGQVFSSLWAGFTDCSGLLLIH